MRRNDIDQAALVFYVMAYSWIERDGLKVRAITRGVLVAVSVTSFGGLGAAQAETQQAIKAAHASGFKEGRASVTSKPRAQVSPATGARKVRSQIERTTHV